MTMIDCPATLRLVSQHNLQSFINKEQLSSQKHRTTNCIASNRIERFYEPVSLIAKLRMRAKMIDSVNIIGKLFLQ